MAVRVIVKKQGANMKHIMQIILGFAAGLFGIYTLILALSAQPANVLYLVIFGVVMFVCGIGMIWLSIEIKRLENPNRRWHN